MLRRYRQYQVRTAPVFVPPPVVRGWFRQLNEPAKIEPGLGAAWQQVSTIGGSTAAVLITDLRNYWFQPLSMPVGY